MNSTTYLNRSRLTTTLLVSAFGVLGLLAACSTDGGNPSPTNPPVISTGGGGKGGGTVDEDAGESSVGGTIANGGSGHTGGNGGSDDIGGAGEGGEAGTGPVSPSCPSTDLEFLNQPTTSQKAPFDNDKRLGAQAALPPLP
jgi:hypothetical protein